MSPSVVEIEHHPTFRVIRLNRPERKNALNDELGWAIVEAVEAAARGDVDLSRDRESEALTEGSQA